MSAYLFEVPLAKREGKRPIGSVRGIDERIILKWMLKK
jgi:hypothetical protein